MIVLHHLLRLLLSLVFLISGTIKLLDVGKFAASVGDFGLVPDRLVLATAWVVVVLELALGSCLACNVRGSLAGAFVLLGIFITVLSYGISIGLDVECGCFGPAFHVDLKTQVIIDLGLVALAGAVYWTGKLWRTEQPTVTLENGTLDN